MKIGFQPQTKDDWRLLLKLVKRIRLAPKKDIEEMLAIFDALDERRLDFFTRKVEPHETPRRENV